MVLAQILQRLADGPTDTDEAARLSRIGFLEWVWSLPDLDTVDAEAKSAHWYVEQSRIDAPAVQAFCDLLDEATLPRPIPRRNGGSRARRLLN